FLYLLFYFVFAFFCGWGWVLPGPYSVLTCVSPNFDNRDRLSDFPTLRLRTRLIFAYFQLELGFVFESTENR
ncbi:MAG: hypothetical protein AB1861_05890, partial [Cyanobacteriota bacterium]